MDLNNNTTETVVSPEPRSILELLKLMLSDIQNFDTSLCIWAAVLVGTKKITRVEYLNLNKYIRTNRPENVLAWTAYWYPENIIEPRIEWINEHIIKLTSNDK